MREHALPQDVTGYRFHIIGNMTLRQFAEVAIGFVIAFLLYQTNLVEFIKWPAIVLSAGAGALIAFVPFEERPLDQWVLVFFRALYRPTQFYWRRTPKIPEAFLYQVKSDTKNLVGEVDLSPARKQRVLEYLSSIETPPQPDAVEQYNNQRLGEIMTVFSQGLPEIQVAARRQPSEYNSASDVIRVAQQLQALSNEAKAPTPPPTTVAPNQRPTTQVVVPALETISVSSPTMATDTTTPPGSTQSVVDTNQTNVAPNQTIQTVGSVTQNKSLPFPEQPTEPNKVVGMVLDNNSIPQVNAIVEIVTPQGIPARAVKTNLLGQFFITTPLSPGTYVLQAEKDGLQFQPLQLIINNQILQPIEVRSI